MNAPARFRAKTLDFPESGIQIDRFVGVSPPKL